MSKAVQDSQKNFVRRRALLELERTFLVLTANLLRIIRGSGQPHLIMSHFDDFFAAMVSYKDVSGEFPTSFEISPFLGPRQDPDQLAKLSTHSLERLRAKEGIIRGALQIAASRLLEQRTQERAGESEMDDGINRIEAVHADIRRAISLDQYPVAREHGTHKKGTGKTITPRPR